MEAIPTVVFLILVAAATAFWIWALVDVARRPDGTYRSGSQLIWAVVITVTHSLGALVYVLFGRPRTGTPAASVGR